MTNANAPRLPSAAQVGLALVLAGGAAWLLVLLERLTLVSLGGGSLRAAGVLALWSIHATAVYLGLLAIAVLVLLGASVGRRLRPSRRALLEAASIGIITAVPTYFVGRAAASGSWIAQQSYAEYIPWAAAGTSLFAGTVGTWLTLRYAPAGRASRATAGLWSLLLVIAASGAAVLDLTVFPNLHVPFHLFLHATAGLLTAAVCARLGQHVRARSRGFANAWLFVGLIGPLAAYATLANTVGSTRSALLLRSTTAANWIRTLSPPNPKDQRYVRDALALLDAAAFSEKDLSLRSPSNRRSPSHTPYNVLFVTVDTFRADTLPPARGEGKRHAQPGDTPRLDAWLDTAFRFRRAYAQASMTHRSLPPTFRSLEAYENPESTGVPLATAMADIGRVPVAVVSNFFIEPRFRRIQQLGEGFHQIAVFDKTEMEREVELVRETLDPLRKQPFFAWVHFYCMHQPGFDGRLLGRPDGPWFERYRRSLRWLDAQMGELFDYLDATGLRENTIIVLAADHGEGLGDNRVQTHGPTAFDEEIRTPLAISIPGQPGREVAATVGNIDILPTLYDLLGAEPEPTHRGHSLAPLMASAANDETWPHSYYAENSTATMVAVMRGEQKLIWDRKAGAFYRFDLSRDPTEDESLYGDDVRADTRLLLALVQKNPGLFRKELEHEDTQAQLLAAWQRATDAVANSSLDFLLRLTALRPTAETQSAAAELFATTDDDRVRLLILRHLFARGRKAWSARLERHLASLAGTPRELEFVDALASQGQGPFATKFVIARIGELGKHGTKRDWLPWLRLIEPWKKRKSADVEAVLLPLLLEHDDAEFDERTLQLLLLNLASLKSLANKATPHPELVDRLARLAESGPVNVQIAACRALGKAADANGEQRLALRVADESADVRVRQAAMYAYVERRNVDAIPLVAEHGKHPFLTVNAVKLMKRIGHPDGLPFLRDISKNYYNGLIRKEARRAISAIERKRKAKKNASKKAASKNHSPENKATKNRAAGNSPGETPRVAD